MKKLLTLLFVILVSLPFSSCRESESTWTKDYPAQATDITGAWQCYINGTFFDFTFNNGVYTLQVSNAIKLMNSTSTKIVLTEIGTYTTEDNTMVLTNEDGEAGHFSNLELYWSSLKHSTLYIFPVGEFSRLY